MIAVWVILALVVVLAIYLIALYNGLVTKRNRVDNAWAQIEVQLKRRRDLIPNLVETVKGYAAHERGTFEAVTQARAAAAGAQGPAATAAAEGILTQALGRLFAVAEAYPDLKASTNFLDLQTQLQDTENKIAVSRQVYNDTVLTFNNAIQVFPAVVDRGPVRLHPARVLRGRGCRRPRGPGGQLPAGRSGSPGRPGSSPRRRCARAAERLASSSLRRSSRSRSRGQPTPSRSRCRRPRSRCRSPRTAASSSTS